MRGFHLSSGRFLKFMGGLWALTILAATFAAFSYELRPAPPAHPEIAAHASPPARDGRHQLLIFAHPNCPCTRATLSELAKLLARLDGEVTATVYFYKPQSNLAQVATSENWKIASAIPGVRAIHDANGKITARHDAKTSGQVQLYSPDGTLVFSGGITAARGHEGYNPGAASIIDLVAGESVGFVQTPVFGCALADPDSIFLREQPSWSKR